MVIGGLRIPPLYMQPVTGMSTMWHTVSSGIMRSDPRHEMLASTCRSKVSSDRKEGEVTESSERAHHNFNPSSFAWTPPTWLP